MRATLIYNEKAGTAASEEEVVAELGKVGWDVGRCLSKKHLDDCPCHGAEVVVVAGGDGTVEKVAKRLAGTSVPMAIVPMGTANNVARSLGIGVDPHAAVLGLSRPLERRMDLGVVRSGRAKEYFLEGFGLGVFAHFVAEKATKKDKTLPKALSLIADELEKYVPRYFELEAEGRDLSGLYVLAAVMNACSLGPVIGVAPNARCDDGELDVVLIRPDERRSLVAHLRSAVEEGQVALPALETSRAKLVRVRVDGGWAHLDDRARQLEGDTCVEVAAGAVQILAPSPVAVHDAGGR